MNETQVILPITDPNRPDFAWLNEDSKLFCSVVIYWKALLP